MLPGKSTLLSPSSFSSSSLRCPIAYASRTRPLVLTYGIVLPGWDELQRYGPGIVLRMHYAMTDTDVAVRRCLPTYFPGADARVLWHQSNNWYTYEFGRRMLDSKLPDAILLTQGDVVTNSIRYQQVRHLRYRLRYRLHRDPVLTARSWAVGRY